MMRCNEPHPDLPGVICDCARTPHRLCSGWHEEIQSYIDWPNSGFVASKQSPDTERARQTIRKAASRVQAREAAVEGSEKAVARWSNAEQLQVRAAIVVLAQEVDTFTTDDVWELLGDDVPKGPGITAMLRQAVSEGYIEPTEKQVQSRRQDRGDHDYGRYLRVWRSISR